MKYDLLIKNLRVVRPTENKLHQVDVAIRNGKFAKISIENAENWKFTSNLGTS